MQEKQNKNLYKVIFYNQGNVYEIYARNVSQGNLFGFIELKDLVFGEKSSVIVDPAEDILKKEFEMTKRIHIPMHSIIRIDEVDKNTGLKPRILELKGSESKSAGRMANTLTPIYSPGEPSE